MGHGSETNWAVLGRSNKTAGRVCPQGGSSESYDHAYLHFPEDYMQILMVYVDEVVV